VRVRMTGKHEARSSSLCRGIAVHPFHSFRTMYIHGMSNSSACPPQFPWFRNVPTSIGSISSGQVRIWRSKPHIHPASQKQPCRPFKIFVGADESNGVLNPLSTRSYSCTLIPTQEPIATLLSRIIVVQKVRGGQRVALESTNLDLTTLDPACLNLQVGL
jgi:hypothetical protein